MPYKLIKGTTGAFATGEGGIITSVNSVKWEVEQVVFCPDWYFILEPEFEDVLTPLVDHS